MRMPFRFEHAARFVWFRAGSMLVAAGAFACSPASAADLPVKAPAPPPAVSWSGIYGGIGFGTRSVEASGSVLSGTVNGANIVTCAGGCVADVPFDGTAFRVSGYAGFNWQIARWVAGVEGDVGFADGTIGRSGMLYPGGGSPIYLTGRGNDGFSVEPTWDASIRARLGFLVTPSILAYATGGVAWQHFETTSICGPISCAPGGFAPSIIANYHTNTGWTAGGGFEAMISPRWIARAEYRYADLGSATDVDTRTLPGATQVATYATALRTHAATLGVAYKFGAPGVAGSTYAANAPSVEGPAPSWTGLYVGGGLGGVASEVEGSVVSATDNGVPIVGPSCLGGCVPDESLHGTAFRASLYAGYNWQFAPRWLAGVEADAGWSDHETKLGGVLYPGGGNPFYLTGRGDDAFSVRTTWDASVRARLGFLVTPTFLAYATGGGAWQQFDTTSTCGASASCVDFSPRIITNGHVNAGWTAGGGFEAMLTPRWIARGEYRYADFGSATDTDTRSFPGLVQVATYTTTVKTHTATIGLAYKFGGTAPVVAKD
jgi:outer membrane immunogenic protein